MNNQIINEINQTTSMPKVSKPQPSSQTAPMRDFNTKPIKTSTIDEMQVKAPDLDQISNMQTPLPRQHATPSTISIPTPTPSTTSIPTSTPNGQSIREQFDLMIKNLDKKTGQELAEFLNNLRNRIQEEIGYVSILSPIANTITDLNQISGLISLSDKQGFISRINFWKNKLNL